MCTIILAWQVFPDAPVVVAANRDERLDRPSEPPQKIEDDPAVIAPRDREAGGTWIGVNEHGLFVGVANRWGDTPEGDRSRGLLVRDLLQLPDAETAVREVENELETTRYEGFNLVVADERAAFLLAWDGFLRLRQFDPGVHVVVNVGTPDASIIPADRQDEAERQADSAGNVQAAMAPEPGEKSGAWLDRAATVLSDHDYGACRHESDRGFGTHSSSLISVGEEGVAYRYADGPPCEMAYELVDSQF